MHTILRNYEMHISVHIQLYNSHAIIINYYLNNYSLIAFRCMQYIV